VRNLEALAGAESRDTGKPLRLARTLDIPRAVANLRFFATAVLHESSEAYQTDEHALNVTLRRPVGVAACISPWNLPLYLFTWKIAPALATGNCVVGKPSELTPMTAFRLGEIACEAGLPPGVLNIVHGAGAGAGAALVEHPGVDAISFTGGTRTGGLIGQAAARGFKKAALELGGKNPTLVFADADLDAVVPEVVRAAFSNQGQICLCGSRVLVEASRYDAFLERFTAAVRALRLGDPLDPETDQGSLVSAAHRDKVLSYVRLAEAEGGTLLCGGGRPAALPERCRDGFFLEPTVVTQLGPECRVNQEEVFGPLVSVIPFTDEREVLAWANGTTYGLSASVFTRALDRAHRLAERLESGTVWINCWLVRDLRVPFGGMKQSGIGRESIVETVLDMTEQKTIVVNEAL